MDLIQTLEHEEIARLDQAPFPSFAPGDTVIVSVNVVEGTRKRLQAFEGVVIAKRNRSLNSSFIVRKMSSGEGVERTFQTLQPADRLDRGQAPRRRPPRQAVLPARALGQVGPHQREAGLTPARRCDRRARQPASTRSAPPSSAIPTRTCRPIAAGDASTPAALRRRFARAARVAARDRRSSGASSSASRPRASVLIAVVLRDEADGAAHAAHRPPQRPSGPDQLSRRPRRARRRRRGGHGAARGATRRSASSRVAVEVLGSLPTYTTAPASSSRRWSALVRPGFAVAPDPFEVAEVFEVPLALADEPGATTSATPSRSPACGASSSRCRGTARTPTGSRTRYFIWGATAAMLRNLYRFLAA